MRNFIIAALLAAAVCSCGKEGIRRPDADRGDRTGLVVPGRGDEGTTGASGQGDTTIYTVGVEYPLAYDWQRDTAWGSVSCRIVLFAGQKRKLEIPAGAGTAVSPDPDRHRVRDGHLYSDCRRDGFTMVLKDGVEIFRYEGEEAICGFMVQDGSVLTLGRRISGKGFSYRRDGEAILVDEEGTLIGDSYSTQEEGGLLRSDEGRIYFAFWKVEDEKKQWLGMVDGKVVDISGGRGFGELLDFRMEGGRFHLCGVTPRYKGTPLYVCGDKSLRIGIQSGMKAVGYCHIVPSGDGISLVMEQIAQDGTRETGIWREDGTRIDSGTDRAGYWLSDGKFSTLACSEKGEISGIIRDGRAFPMEDAVRIYSHDCVRYGSGALLVAATPVRKDLNPFVWKNGKRTVLSLHGYLSGVWVSPR